MEGTLARVANGNAPVWALGHTEYLQYSDSLESEHRFVSEILQANPFEVLMLLMLRPSPSSGEEIWPSVSRCCFLFMK